MDEPRRHPELLKPAVPIPLLMTVRDIRAHVVNVSERLIREWVSTGKFPRHDARDGAKLVFWRRETVLRWYDSYVQSHTAAGAEARKAG